MARHRLARGWDCDYSNAWLEGNKNSEAKRSEVFSFNLARRISKQKSQGKRQMVYSARKNSKQFKIINTKTKKLKTNLECHNCAFT